MPDNEWVRLTAEGRDKHWGVFHYRRTIEGGIFDHTLRWMNPPHRFEVFTHLTTAELAAIPAVKALVEAARAARSVLEHEVPYDCWATGPNTGDPIVDLVACHACAAIAQIDTALAALDGKEEAQCL